MSVLWWMTLELLAILDKMAKQRQESIHHYQAAHRDDLVAQENFELEIIQNYLPAPLSEKESWPSSMPLLLRFLSANRVT